MATPPSPARSTGWWKIAAAVIGGILALALLYGIIGIFAESSEPEAADSSALTTLPTRTRSPAEIQQAQAQRAARLDPASYRAISPRDFALLVKDPESHKGEKIIIYGIVTQFDAATGTTEFRADTGAEASTSYSQNSYVTALADPAILSNVVEDDTLKMYVEVAGAHTYDTQIGGETTVPKFWVYIVENLTATQGPR